MVLYYSGATTHLGVQTNPNRSLGGKISSSLIPPNSLSSIFGTVPDVVAGKILRERRLLVLQNTTGSEVSTSKIWYVNQSQDPVTSYKMALVAPGISSCNEPFFESITDGSSSPVAGTFSDNHKEINSLILPSIPVSGYIGIWIERSTIGNQVQKGNSCDEMYDKFKLISVAQVQTITFLADTVINPLEEKYFLLDTPQGKYYIWYGLSSSSVNPNIAGREGIRVQHTALMTAEQIAEVTKTSLDDILGFRGEITTTIETNTLTITNITTGPTPSITTGNSGHGPITTVTEGVTTSEETLELIDLFINY